MNQVELDEFNYFELFGLEPTYEIDEASLHRKYLSLTRSIHPDVAGRQSEEDRQQSLSLSSELNRAYDTLRDPVARAEYLLSHVGEAAMRDKRSVPPETLGEIMMFREEIEEAQTAGDSAGLQTLRRQVIERQQSLKQTIDALARSLPDSDAGTQKELREQLNVIKYWSNLLDRLPPGD